MSTGADAKTMPVTREYEDNHARIFGDRKIQRGTFVMRCSACDGVQHPEDARQYMCPQCRQWTYASVDASAAPPPPEEAISAPIMAGRFYENTVATDGTDIGSRTRHREYMHRNGLTTADDYKQTWAKADEERARIRAGEPMPDKERREQIGRVAYEVEKKRARRR